MRQTSLSSSQVAGEEAPQCQGRAKSLMHTSAKCYLQKDQALANTLAVRDARVGLSSPQDFYSMGIKDSK